MVFELSSNGQFSSFLGWWDQRYDGGRVVMIGYVTAAAAASSNASSGSGGEWIRVHVCHF